MKMKIFQVTVSRKQVDDNLIVIFKVWQLELEGSEHISIAIPEW